MQRPPPVKRFAPQERNVELRRAGHPTVNLRRGGEEEAREAANYRFVNHNARQGRPNVITFGSNQADYYTTEDNRGFSIEGTKTGEEVVVEKVEPRQPARRKSSLPSSSEAGPSPSLLAELESLRKKVSQLQSEKKTMSEKLQKIRKETDAVMKGKELIIDELLARRSLEVDHILEQKGKTLNMCSTMASLYAELFQSHQKLERALDEINAKEEKERRASQDKRDELMEKLQALENEKKEASADNNSTQNDLQAQITMLKEKLNQTKAERDQSVHQLERELADVQERLVRSIREVEDSTKKRAEDAFLVAQCRLFVRNICNPGFSVVKDESLQPVSRDRSEPSGYVLVPLTTLLHGYTLLPEEERKGVISSYDERTKGA
ncbi:hypothetical protein AGDE_14265 [Angomonas deanei]|nr:hypothetical protein AGDE_14265 [Angomonas deanei]|eukprot:EPY21156.1 hypothetical protein AGDE_14265 [Angomonas deanei]